MEIKQKNMEKRNIIEGNKEITANDDKMLQKYYVQVEDNLMHNQINKNVHKIKGQQKNKLKKQQKKWQETMGKVRAKRQSSLCKLQPKPDDQEHIHDLMKGIQRI